DVWRTKKEGAGGPLRYRGPTRHNHPLRPRSPIAHQVVRSRCGKGRRRLSLEDGMNTDVTDILRATDLLGSASAADLEGVAAASRPRTFRGGQILFSAGDPGDTVIVVISGRVKIVVRSADGGELTLTVLGPGGVLG